MSKVVPAYMVHQKLMPGGIVATYSRHLADLRHVGDIDTAGYSDDIPSLLAEHELFELDYSSRNSALAASRSFFASLDGEVKRYRSFLSKAFRDLVAVHGQSDRENFMVATLNNQNLLNGLSVVSSGAVDTVTVSMREVMKVAIAQGASKIFVAHNHPSARTIRRKGKPDEHIGFEPSEHDIELTAALMFACRSLNITFIDHMILGEIDAADIGTKKKQHFFTFMESGLLDAIMYEYSRKKVKDVFADFAEIEKPSKDSLFKRISVPSL